MASIRCKACGCTYDYNKEGMCPKCGAYNRPPHRERVDPDGRRGAGQLSRRGMGKPEGQRP